MCRYVYFYKENSFVKKKNHITELLCGSITAAYLFFLSFVAALQNTDSIWGNGESWVDASVYKYVAWMMDLGYMPYKDTFDHKGPLVYLFFWLGRKISSWRGVWVLYLGMIFLTFLVIYLIFRKFCSRIVSALLMPVVFAVAFDYAAENISPENLSVPFMACALYIFIDYFLDERITKWRLLLTGACFGCVLMIKAQMVSVWFVFCIAVLIKNIREKTFPKIGFFLAWFLAGCLAVVLPQCIWLIRGGAWKDFIEDYIIFNMQYSKSYSGSTPMESTLAKCRAMVFFFNKPVVLICLFLCVALICMDRSNRFFHTSYLVYILLSIAVAALAGRTYRHYGSSLLVAVSCPLAMFASAASGLISGENLPLQQRSGSRNSSPAGNSGPDRGQSGRAGSGLWKRMPWVSGAAFLGLAYLVCIYAAPVFFTKLDDALDIWQVYEAGDTELSANLQGMLDVIAANTSADDRITVHGLYDILYGKSERLSASRYSFQHAFAKVDPARNDEYYAELDANPPKLIIQGDTDPDRMMEFITSHGYHWIADSPDGDYRIYKRFDREELPSGTWGEELCRTTSLTDYLDRLYELEEEHGLMVFMTVRGKAGGGLSVKNTEQLQALGFDGTDLLLDDGYHTFIGVSSGHESLYESIGGDGADRYEGTIKGLETGLISATKHRGNQASVSLGGVEYALNQRGLNIVVYDPETSFVIDSVAFDTQSDEGVTCIR